MVNRVAENASATPLFMKKDLSGTPSEPDISDPGPDMGNYPNSAYTLRQGRIYVESAPFGYQTGNAQGPAAWNWPFLLRYGLTDDVELRLTGNGLTSLQNPSDGKTGFAPLILDTKVHLWDEQMDRFIPAAGLEVSVQTNLGSKELQVGVQPSLNLNLDFPLTDETNVEMTLGYTGVQADVEVNQCSFQWAVEQQVTNPLQLFVHGYYLAPAGSLDFSHVIGAGGFYQLSKSMTLFTSANAAIDHNSPPFSTQLGLAFAF
ncbi:MAG: transporter [Planctomycetia bacterium]